MISDAKTYADNQGIPDDSPSPMYQLRNVRLTWEERLIRDKDHEQDRQNKVWKRKQSRIRDLIAALKRLSGNLLAVISVAERQIAVLQNLHDLFSPNCRTKIQGHGKGYPPRENPFYKNIAPILSENSEQILPGVIDTIDEVGRERKCFIKKVQELVENMDIQRKIV